MTTYNTYSLEGNFSNDSEAIDFARGFVFSECEKKEQEIFHAKLIDEVAGIKVYYCYGADHYFFCDRLEETVDDKPQVKNEPYPLEFFMENELTLPLGAKLIREDNGYVMGMLRNDETGFATWSIDHGRKSFSNGHYDMNFYSAVCNLKGRANHEMEKLVIAPKTKLHFFSDTKEAYDACMTGVVPQWETFIVESEDVVGMAAGSWPIAFTKSHGEVHRITNTDDEGLVKYLKELHEEINPK